MRYTNQFLYKHSCFDKILKPSMLRVQYAIHIKVVYFHLHSILPTQKVVFLQQWWDHSKFGKVLDWILENCIKKKWKRNWQWNELLNNILIIKLWFLLWHFERNWKWFFKNELEMVKKKLTPSLVYITLHFIMILNMFPSLGFYNLDM